MRIALLHFTGPPVIGGVEQVIAAHAQLLRAGGHEVSVCTGAELDPPAIGTHLEKMNLVMAHNLLTMPFRPDVTEVLWDLAEQSSGTRFISWVHDVAAANPHYQVPPGDRLRRHSPHFEYVAVSEERREQLHAALGLPPEACRVIPNGFSPEALCSLAEPWAGLAREWRLYDRDLVLFQPARLVRRKNVELSLEVTSALRDGGMDAVLLVTAPSDVHYPASAAYGEEVRQLRARLGLQEAAHFLSDHHPVNASAMQGFYQLADAVFFPSTQEGFGLPLLEAAFYRVPIVCARREPLTTVALANALFFEPDATAEEIAILVRHRLITARAIQARKAAVREYAWPVVYRNFIIPLLAAPWPRRAS